ncbi:hypothetical protein JCM15765_03960 [Paradesulfitobacterium aromaticivorans]
MRFLKNKWVWALGIFIIFSVSWNAYISFAKSSTDMQSAEKQSPERIVSNQQQTQSNASQGSAAIEPVKLNDNQDSQDSGTYEKAMQKIRAVAKNPIIQAEEDKIYSSQTDVVVGKSQLLVLKGYTTSIGKVFYLGKYYLIVDFGIYNLSEQDYVSLWDNFSLRDASGYSYLPSYKYPYLNGDVEGIIKPGESRRGQIAFEITTNDQVFSLDFSTNVKSPNTVHFLIDLTQYMKQFQSNPSTQG